MAHGRVARERRGKRGDRLPPPRVAEVVVGARAHHEARLGVVAQDLPLRLQRTSALRPGIREPRHLQPVRHEQRRAEHHGDHRPHDREGRTGAADEHVATCSPRHARRSSGAAQESNLPPAGLRRATGFEDRVGHQPRAAPGNFPGNSEPTPTFRADSRIMASAVVIPLLRRAALPLDGQPRARAAGGPTSRTRRRWRPACAPRLEDAERRLTRFDPGSELSRLNADPREEVPVSPLLARLVLAARWAGERSGGLVDATLLP